MPKRSLQVYFITHADGRRSGLLLRRWDAFFDKPAPAAYGHDEEDVLQQLAVQLAERAAENDPISRYLWDESFEVRRADVTTSGASTWAIEMRAVSVCSKAALPDIRIIPLRVEGILAESSLNRSFFARLVAAEVHAGAPLEELRPLWANASRRHADRARPDRRQQHDREVLRTWAGR